MELNEIKKYRAQTRKRQVTNPVLHLSWERSYKCKKIKKLTITLTLATISMLTACDCLQNISGTIIDAETNQPLQGAEVKKENKNYIRCETDEHGKFTLESISGGLFGCPPMSVVVSKAGYETKTVQVDHASHEKIILQRIE